VTKLHLSALIVLGLPWLRSTNPTIDWSAFCSVSKQALDQHAIVGLGQGMLYSRPAP